MFTERFIKWKIISIFLTNIFKYERVFVLGDSFCSCSYCCCSCCCHFFVYMCVWISFFFFACFCIVSPCAVLAPASIFNVFLFKNNTTDSTLQLYWKSKLNIIKCWKLQYTEKAMLLFKDEQLSIETDRQNYGIRNKDKVKRNW